MSQSLSLLAVVVLALDIKSVSATTTGDGTCYQAQCGCPGGAYLQNWCTDENSLVVSDWCQESTNNCQNSCSGTWCTDSVEDDDEEEIENACYISECGCPDAYLQPWCESSSTLVQSEWCQEQENRCTVSCSGTWCAGSSTPTTDDGGGAGGGGGGGGSRTCFSGDDKVTLKSGEHIKFSKLKIGDSIMSATRDGKISFSKVVFLPHGENDTPTKFLSIMTESEKKIKMTAGHLVQLCSGKLVTAHELTVHDAATSSPSPSDKANDEESDEESTLTSCLRTVHGNEHITNIQEVVSNGVYTAVTENEFLVVNGIIASPFAHSAVLAHAYFNLTDVQDWCSSHNWKVYDSLKQDHQKKKKEENNQASSSLLNVLQEYDTHVSPSEDCMVLVLSMFQKFKSEPVGWGVDGWGYRGWANPASAHKNSASTTTSSSSTKHRQEAKPNHQKKKEGGGGGGGGDSSPSSAQRSLRVAKNSPHDVPIPAIIAGWEG